MAAGIRALRAAIAVMSVVLVAGTSLSACGSSGDPDGDEAKVGAIIRRSLTTRDPAVCRELMTQRFLEQIQLTSGQAAVRECEEDTRTDEPADRATVSQVAIGDGRARARVAVQGGDDDGARYDLRLVKRGGDWRLDRIAAVELDFERYLRAGRRGLVRAPDELSAKEADCVVADIRDVGEARLENAIVAGDATVFTAAVLSCISARELRRQFESGIRSGLAGRADGDCVVARLRRSVTLREVRVFVAAQLGGTGVPPSLQRALADAVSACGPAGDSGETA